MSTLMSTIPATVHTESSISHICTYEVLNWSGHSLINGRFSGDFNSIFDQKPKTGCV